MMISILILLVVLYLLAIKPNNKRLEKFKAFENVYISHRGLFNNKDIPENSLEAFKLTVKNGYGSELDVQLTKDNKLVVFHDESLKRMCGVDKNLRDLTYEELQNLNLLNTNIKIPLFKDVLEILKKDTPLIVEIKAEGDYLKTTDEAIKLLKEYDRLWVMESFNCLVVKHLKDNYPEIIRGQLSFNMFKEKRKSIFSFLYTYLFFNFFTKPDFIAYDVKNMNNLSFKIISKLYKSECVAWTVKDQATLEKAKKYYRQFIFDSFIPDEPWDN